METVCKVFYLKPGVYQVFKQKWKQIGWIKDGDDVPNATQAERIKAAGFALEAPDLDALQEEGFNQDTEKDWYWMTHHYQGAEMFNAVLAGWPYLVEAKGFLKDSLFCEYGYILDLDRDTLEFYKGFQKIYGHIDQFPGYYYEDDTGYMGMKRVRGGYKYGPCKKVGERPLNDLDGWQVFYHEDD